MTPTSLCPCRPPPTRSQSQAHEALTATSSVTPPYSVSPTPTRTRPFTATRTPTLSRTAAVPSHTRTPRLLITAHEKPQEGQGGPHHRGVPVGAALHFQAFCPENGVRIVVPPLSFGHLAAGACGSAKSPGAEDNGFANVLCVRGARGGAPLVQSPPSSPTSRAPAPVPWLGGGGGAGYCRTCDV